MEDSTGFHNFERSQYKDLFTLEKKPEYWIFLIIKKGTPYHLPLNLLEGWYRTFNLSFNCEKVNNFLDLVSFFSRKNTMPSTFECLPFFVCLIERLQENPALMPPWYLFHAAHILFHKYLLFQRREAFFLFLSKKLLE